MRGIAGILVLVSKTRTRLGSLRGSLGSSCLTITTRGASFDITNIEMTLRLVCRDWADLPLYGLFFCFPRVFGLPTFFNAMYIARRFVFKMFTRAMLHMHLHRPYGATACTPMSLGIRGVPQALLFIVEMCLIMSNLQIAIAGLTCRKTAEIGKVFDPWVVWAFLWTCTDSRRLCSRVS